MNIVSQPNTSDKIVKEKQRDNIMFIVNKGRA